VARTRTLVLWSLGCARLVCSAQGAHPAAAPRVTTRTENRWTGYSFPLGNAIGRGITCVSRRAPDDWSWISAPIPNSGKRSLNGNRNSPGTQGTTQRPAHCHDKTGDHIDTDANSLVRGGGRPRPVSLRTSKP
jgi:hypothetical protein